MLICFVWRSGSQKNGRANYFQQTSLFFLRPREFYHLVISSGCMMKVRVLDPKPLLAMITRVAPGRTECKFGGRVWNLDWAGGTTTIKLTTLQTMQVRNLAPRV